MAEWLSKIVVKDLHEDRRSGKLTIAQVARELSKRIKANTYAKKLEAVRRRLKTVKTDDEYDACLEALYGFGDYGHRIWIESM